jgi:hypothetical protein
MGGNQIASESLFWSVLNFCAAGTWWDKWTKRLKFQMFLAFQLRFAMLPALQLYPWWSPVLWPEWAARAWQKQSLCQAHGSFPSMGGFLKVVSGVGLHFRPFLHQLNPIHTASPCSLRHIFPRRVFLGPKWLRYAEILKQQFQASVDSIDWGQLFHCLYHLYHFLPHCLARFRSKAKLFALPLLPHATLELWGWPHSKAGWSRPQLQRSNPAVYFDKPEFIWFLGLQLQFIKIPVSVKLYI